MTTAPRIVLVLVTLASFVAVPAASAEDLGPTGHAIMATSEARALIDDGIEHSPTFAHLVDELDRSDVIVAVELRIDSRYHVRGYTVFVTRTSIRRYLRIYVETRLRPQEQIAIIGHELSHALEVAAAPEVVDESTLRDLYARIGCGYGNRWDSERAIEIGRTIARELVSSAVETAR